MMKASKKSTLSVLALSFVAGWLVITPAPSFANALADSTSTADSPAASSTPSPKTKDKATMKKKKFTKKPAQKKDVATAENKPPTQLPQYKRKTKVIIDFDSGSPVGSASPTVVDRSQFALAESERERAEADKLMRENFTKPGDESLTPKHITRHKTVIVESNTTAAAPQPSQPPKPQPMIDVTSAPAGAAIPNIEQTLKQPKLAPEPHRAPLIIVDRDFDFNLHDVSQQSSQQSSEPRPQSMAATPISTVVTPAPPRPTFEVFGPPPPPPAAVQASPPATTPVPQAPAFVGPIAPTPIVTALQPSTAPPPPEPGAPATETASASPTASSTRGQADFALFATPETQGPSYHFLLRASYLDAQYSQLESDLQNGATSFSAGVSRTYGGTLEGSLAIEVGQGMDQAITLQDTRFLLLRAGANYIFLPGMITPIAGLSLGYGNFNVFSYHTTNGSTIQLVENAQVSGLVAAPSAGVRLNLASSYTLDLTAEYLVLVGGSDASALGGLAGALTVGIPF